MIADLHNLLPPAIKRTLRTRYYLRVCTIFAFMAAACLVAGAVALVPAYATRTSIERTLEAELTQLRTQIEQQGVDRDLINTMRELVQRLAAYSQPHATAQLAMVDSYADGLLISSYVFDLTHHKVVVEGVSPTRSALVTFADALEADELVASVSLPLSSLAAREDVSFELSATLSTSSSESRL